MPSNQPSGPEPTVCSSMDFEESLSQPVRTVSAHGLPLKLNAFERYMWADDQAEHPMSFFVQVTYSGRLDESAWLRAIEQALCRHPLLRARVTGDRDLDLSWVASPDPLPQVDCTDAAEPMRFATGYRIDLRIENGLRIWIRRSDERGEIRFQFHHSCCDGIAANQFIADVLRAYDVAVGRPGGDSLPFSEVDFTRLPRRNRFGANWLDWLGRRIVDLWGMALGPAIFLLTRPASLRTSHVVDDHSQDGEVVPDLVTWRFTKTQFTNLLTKARTSDATLNDLLLRDVFLTVGAWNREHCPEPNRDLIRIMVPFNLRGPEHRNLPAVNIVGMANLDRRFHWPWYKNAQRLLRGIQLETWFLKSFRIVTCFPCILWVLGSLPGGLHRYLRPDRCLATCVVSNLGRIFLDTPLTQHDGKVVAGGLSVEAIDTAPPVRDGSGVAMTFCTYAGQLSVSMNYDPHRFRRATAERLLQHIVAQIAQSAELESNTST